MNIRTAVIASVVVISLTACATRREEHTARDGTWVGAITTDGNITTVINRSGSVWGGTATLAEVTSIGVAAGADEYMFGSINALYLTEGEVYVVDSQVPAVRAYDFGGQSVRSYGKKGQGPGEYANPNTVAVGVAGRVFVLDEELRRINVYGSSGEPLDTWPFETGSCCAARMFPLADGSIWKPANERRNRSAYPRLGAQVVGPTRNQEVVWAPYIEYEESTYERQPGLRLRTPYSSADYASPAADGKLVFGASDRYRFIVLNPDGSSLVVERYWDPVPVPPEHKDWRRRQAIGPLEASQIPDHKPAFRWFVPTQSGEIWLQRYGPSEHLVDCTEDSVEHDAANENPCWRDGVIIDVFDGDGRYLGNVDLPEELIPYAGSLAVRGPVVAGVGQDDTGTLVVKVFRLVPPEKE